MMNILGSALCCTICLAVLLACGNPVESVSGDPSSDGLVAYWKLDGTGDDYSGNGYHALISGAVPATDRFGNENSAYFFDGSNDVMEVADFYHWNDGITFSFWTKYQGTTSNAAPLNDKHDEYHLHFQGGNLQFYLCGVDNFMPSYNPPTGQWIHIAATWDGSTMTCYVNGESIGSMPATGSILNSDYPLFVASDESHVYEYYWGSMDDVRIYDRGLNPGEILNLYHEGGWE